MSCAQVSLTVDRFLPTRFSVPIDHFNRTTLLVPGVTERTTSEAPTTTPLDCDSSQSMQRARLASDLGSPNAVCQFTRSDGCLRTRVYLLRTVEASRS